MKILGRRPFANHEANRLALDDIVLDNVDLTLANLRNANLCYSTLNWSSLAGADLRDAYLLFGCIERSFFTHADARGCFLDDAKLRYTFFIDAKLDHASFERADLRDTKFASDNNKVSLKSTNVKDARLDGADLRGIDLSLTIGLTKGQIDSAIIDADTKLPDDLRDRVRTQGGSHS